MDAFWAVSLTPFSVFTVIVCMSDIFKVEVVDFAFFIHQIFLVLIFDLDLTVLLTFVFYYAFVFFVVGVLIILKDLGYSSNATTSLVGY